MRRLARIDEKQNLYIWAPWAMGRELDRQRFRPSHLQLS